MVLCKLLADHRKIHQAVSKLLKECPKAYMDIVIWLSLPKAFMQKVRMTDF